MRNGASRNRRCATRPRPIARWRSSRTRNFASARSPRRSRSWCATTASRARGGDIAYNFADHGIIKKLYVSARLRDQLIRGQLVIVRAGNGYELVPVACAERIRARDGDVIVVWNTPAADQPAEDDPYKDFPIPDDLMW
jgi:hypothetical protein